MNKRQYLGYQTARYVIKTYGVGKAQEESQSLNYTDPVDAYTIGYNDCVNEYFEKMLEE